MVQSSLHIPTAARTGCLPYLIVLLACCTSPILAQEPSAATDVIASDCSACDATLAKPVVHGCADGRSSLVSVEFNSIPISCGAALTIEQAAVTPDIYYPTANATALYTLLLVDTTGIDPSVGTTGTFEPYPLLHYGAVDIPGDTLIDGMTLGIFEYDDIRGVTVQPFLSYRAPTPPIPSKFVPDTVVNQAFNYEFMLAEQKKEEGSYFLESPNNFDFEWFLRRRTDDEVISTYFSVGNCVVEAEAGSERDCEVVTIGGTNANPTMSGGASNSGGSDVAETETPAGASSDSSPTGAEAETHSGGQVLVCNAFMLMILTFIGQMFS